MLFALSDFLNENLHRVAFSAVLLHRRFGFWIKIVSSHNVKRFMELTKRSEH